MNYLDIFFLAVCLLFMIRGFFRGFVRELASIVGIMAGFFAANAFYEQLAPAFGSFIKSPTFSLIASYMAIFVTGMVVVHLLASILKKQLAGDAMKSADRFLGTSLAFIKGIITCGIILLCLSAFLGANTEFIKKSLTAPFISKASYALYELLPESMQKKISEKADSLKNLKLPEKNETQEDREKDGAEEKPANAKPKKGKGT